MLCHEFLEFIRGYVSAIHSHPLQNIALEEVRHRVLEGDDVRVCPYIMDSRANQPH